MYMLGLLLKLVYKEMQGGGGSKKMFFARRKRGGVDSEAF